MANDSIIKLAQKKDAIQKTDENKQIGIKNIYHLFGEFVLVLYCSSILLYFS